MPFTINSNNLQKYDASIRLGYVAIMAAVILAAVSGSAVADAAVLASLLLPMMVAAGHDKARSAGLIASRIGVLTA